ncbi:MAG: glycosyltransferase family 4 protein [Lachnospiraceae bacterium]|nr:glycosyltransferase family 4 protein [Lachnospiraceae bacterium]
MVNKFKKDILIISHFVNFPEEKGNDRFCYLADLLCNRGNSVEIITSDFIHFKKEHRHSKREKYKYKYQLIHEPSYKKNICLRRFYSHYIFAKNVKKYLNTRRKPDVIYCAIPSLDVAKVAAKYARKNHIKFIVDVQDLWPEAFKMVFHVPIVSDLIFAPMKIKANYTYRQADGIVAVSDTYVNRALAVNEKCSQGLSVFLGTDLQKFDKYKSTAKLSEKDGIIRLVYIGTLGHSYDLTCVFDAMVQLKEEGYDDIRFQVIGDGPLKSKFQEYSNKLKLDVEYTGRLEYSDMVSRLTECDIAVNPIVAGSAASIINKVGDYAMSGLPVVNTQECEEYRRLVEHYNMGFNCKNNDAEDLANKLILLIKDAKLREEMGSNARRCAVEMFAREIRYTKILDLI